METFFTILMLVFLVIGVFFAAVGVIGVLRFPGYYARAQAATCITTMGTLGGVAAGLVYVLYNGLGVTAVIKLLMVGAMILVSSAVSGHALSKGTYKRGHRPHEGFAKDDYEEDGFDAN